MMVGGDVPVHLGKIQYRHLEKAKREGKGMNFMFSAPQIHTT